MSRRKQHFSGHIVSLRNVKSTSALLVFILFIITYTAKLPVSKIPMSFLRFSLANTLLDLQDENSPKIRLSSYDFLADTILSIRASEEMGKKYAAKYGGVKKTTESAKQEVQTEALSSKEENLASRGLTFINTPGFPVDAAELLQAPLGFVTKNSDPKVLIVHTHTSEAYAESPNSRNEDAHKNVVSVGAEIAQTLKKRGIGVIHDTTQNDSPSYNQSYKKTMDLIDKNLTQHQTLEIVLDIHRDYIEREDGTLIKPTATVNGKKAAQIMFVMGTDAMGLEHSNWRHNLSFAVKIQNRLNETAPGLCRSINIRTERFNQHMTKGSMIIEVGTGVNTLEEATYAGRLVADAIADVLL